MAYTAKTHDPLRKDKDATLPTKQLDISPSQYIQTEIKSHINAYEQQYVSTTTKEPKKDKLEKDVIVRLKSKDREDWKIQVHFKISTIIKAKHTDVTIIAELTTEEDPFFLYTFECDETEFCQIKNEQCLRVDFQKFPLMLEQLLSNCTDGSEEEKEYCCLLNTKDECSLSIVENNQYRQLIHLTLKLRPGDDDNIKKYLAVQLDTFKRDNTNLQNNLQSTEDKLNEVSDYNSTLMTQITTLREEMKILSDKLKYEHKSELDQITDKQKLEQTKILVETEQSFKSLTLGYESKLQKLTAELDACKSVNEIITGKNKELERKTIELSHSLDKATDELKYYKQDLTTFKSNIKALDATKLTQEKTLTELHMSTQSLSKQLQDKIELLAKTQTLYESSVAQKQQLEEMLSILKTNASKMEEKLQASAQEITKGNSIISKLQADIKSQKQKTKIKVTELTQQDSIINQQKKAIEDTSADMYNTKRDMERKNDEIARLRKEVEDLTSKLNAEAKALISSKDLITHLNSTLNDARRPVRPMPNMGFSTTKSLLPPNYKPAFSTVESVMESAMAYTESANKISGIYKYTPADTLERKADAQMPGLLSLKPLDEIRPQEDSNLSKYVKP